LDRARVQSLTQAVPAWWDWEMVRAGGVGTRGMGKRGRAKDKGKREDDELIGIIQRAAISTSSLFA
jgi:hypothetical protein